MEQKIGVMGDGRYIISQQAYMRTMHGFSARLAGSTFSARQKAYGCPGHLTSDEVRYARESWKECFWCGKAFGAGNRVNLDHIVPLSCGGPNCLEALVGACRSCNSKKGRENPISYAMKAGVEEAKVIAVVAKAYEALNIPWEEAVEKMRKTTVHTQLHTTQGVLIALCGNFKIYDRGLRKFFEAHRPSVWFRRSKRFGVTWRAVGVPNHMIPVFNDWANSHVYRIEHPDYTPKPGWGE